MARLVHAALWLLAATLALAQAPAPTPATKFDVVGCAILGSQRETIATHQTWAMQHFAHEWPHLNVTPKFIGVNQVTSTPRGVTRAFVLQGTDCDIVYGPGLSSIVVTMNPLVDQLWIDGSSATDDFSDKTNYPLFNRIVLATAQTTRNSAIMAKKLGWTKVNVLCAENAIGRSVSAGFANAFKELGGAVDVTCTNEYFNVQNMTSVVRQLMASPVKVVFIAIVHTDVAYASFTQAALDLRADEVLQFMFWEGPCTGSNFNWRKFRGSICATYMPNATVQNLTLTPYFARDRTWELNELARLNYPSTLVTATRTGTYQLIAIDAVRVTMLAFEKFVTQYDRKPNNASEITAYTRAVRLDNFTLTGTADFLPNGDRASASLSILNVVPSANNDTQIIGTILDNQMAFTGTPIYFNTIKEFRPWDNAPASFVLPPAPVTASSGSNTIGIAVAVALAAVVILVVIVVSVLRKGTTRNLAHAPNDSKQPFAVVFTDIQASTHLWASAPELMGPAVDTHHRVIRDLIQKYRGYEVKTIGDSFMVAFKSIKDAAVFAVQLQEAFYNEDFHTHVFDTVIRQKVASDAALVLNDDEYADLWSGLRVRVGLHYGTGTVQLDAVTGAYDYYGTVVNTAARVEGVGHGGQTLLTDDAYRALCEACGGDGKVAALFEHGVAVTNLGPQPLRGLPAPIVLVQMLPGPLGRRVFPPLRLDVEAVVDEGGADGRLSAQSTASESVMDANVNRDEVLWQHCNTLAAKMEHKSNVSNARLWNYAKLLTMLIAPAPRAQQKELVEVLVKLWRVPVSDRGLTSEQFVLKASCVLAGRVAPSFQDATQVLQAGNRTPLMRSETFASAEFAEKQSHRSAGDANVSSPGTEVLPYLQQHRSPRGSRA